MSISAYQNPADVQLKVVNLNNEQTEKASGGIASTKIFGISFTYQKQAYRTKVMKVIYAGKDAMYKVVMPCNINSGSYMHWLQRKGNNWVILLGEEMEPKLLKAVSNAIDCLE